MPACLPAERLTSSIRCIATVHMRRSTNRMSSTAGRMTRNLMHATADQQSSIANFRHCHHGNSTVSCCHSVSHGTRMSLPTMYSRTLCAYKTGFFCSSSVGTYTGSCRHKSNYRHGMSGRSDTSNSGINEGSQCTCMHAAHRSYLICCYTVEWSCKHQENVARC